MIIKINSNTHIFIVSPFYKTGGPMSLHQLANHLTTKGYNVSILYYYDEYQDIDHILYPWCKANVITKIKRCDDKETNVLIVPETCTGILLNFKHITKIVWWLSYSNYLKNDKLVNGISSGAMHLREKYRIPKCFTNILKQIVYFKHYDLYKNAYKYVQSNQLCECYHLYNCEYAHQFLLNNSVPEERTHYLCGPIEHYYYRIQKQNLISIKHNVVVYNPAKMDNSLTEKIIQHVNDIQRDITFIPICNMSREEVFNTIKIAKVYLDLGYFPGPERMPREAVSLFCNIITSNVGSAENAIDVPIPTDCKFVPNESSVIDISNKIIELVNDYDANISRYNEYREKVYNQIEYFEKNIENIFVEE